MNLNDRDTLIELRLARLERAVQDAHPRIALPEWAPDRMSINEEAFQAKRSGVSGAIYWESEGHYRA